MLRSLIAILGLCDSTTSILESSDFDFKFWREEHWLQRFEWRDHIWVIIPIFIQTHTSIQILVISSIIYSI